MADSDATSSSSLVAGGAGAFNQIQQTTHTATVSTAQKLQLPPFTPNSAATWFQRAEVHFRLAAVTNEALKADMVLAMLTAESFEKISSWLKSQPESIKYPDLKLQLVNAYAVPVPVRAQKALDLMLTPLGDTRPSEAWRELMNLIMLDEVDDNGKPREISLSKEIFLRHLPQGDW